MKRRPEPRSTEGKFRRDVKFLREHCPTLLPVIRVYRKPLDKCIGYTHILYDDKGRPRGFTIAIESRMGWQAVWQTLIHEWAHALAWHEGHEIVDDHGPEWALAVSKIYQELVEP